MSPKKIAAEKAVECIQTGMTIGLGTGSTVYWAIHKIAQRIHEGLMIRAVATSNGSEQLAQQLGIPIVPFSEIGQIDLTIDGADEVDAHFDLIKGGGGALLREKIIAANSKQFIVIIDESKQVDKLGRFPLPVEVVPFAAELTIRQIRDLGCTPKIRTTDGQTYKSDNGNLIIDCDFGEITQPASLTARLNSIPGVVDNGLFVQMASCLVVGYKDGTVKLEYMGVN
ncbi:ribose-5-phosphate isomerase RpiA [Paenibacillus agricola]|uniref:Ribose-5-phosphate isomerase A n=1 Tax=Paenibacillus agricola TaxID=2716264 RepID=A0ABX0JAT3_9BACL|nr:ribose-5-phosphate isomerase RpiA [Paenibacillus agricola]NHN33053.1 ribose-5-phosphate isomerase RpiA [Paenibacillus agricola]